MKQAAESGLSILRTGNCTHPFGSIFPLGNCSTLPDPGTGYLAETLTGHGYFLCPPVPMGTTASNQPLCSRPAGYAPTLLDSVRL